VLPADEDQPAGRLDRGAEARVVDAGEADELAADRHPVHEVEGRQLGRRLDHQGSREEGAAGDVVRGPPVLGADVLVPDDEVVLVVHEDHGVEHGKAPALLQHLVEVFLGVRDLIEVDPFDFDEGGDGHGARGGGRLDRGSVAGRGGEASSAPPGH